MSPFSSDDENLTEDRDMFFDGGEEYFGEDYLLEEKEIKHKQKVYALVIYDIAENKKRTQFAKFMNAFGTRVQKSCFEAAIPLSTFKKMLKGIEKYADDKDSIRVYRLTSKSQVYTWGKEGVVEEDDVLIF